jgi:hypothetical protein
MARKKQAQGAAAPFQSLRKAFDRITQSESVPSLDALLELGSELHEARLNYDIEGAIPHQPYPVRLAVILAFTACRHHEHNDNDRARLKDDQHVQKLLVSIEERPDFWPYVRDGLIQLSRCLFELLSNRRVFPASLHESCRLIC